MPSSFVSLVMTLVALVYWDVSSFFIFHLSWGLQREGTVSERKIGEGIEVSGRAFSFQIFLYESGFCIFKGKEIEFFNLLT